MMVLLKPNSFNNPKEVQIAFTSAYKAHKDPNAIEKKTSSLPFMIITMFSGGFSYPSNKALGLNHLI